MGVTVYGPTESVTVQLETMYCERSLNANEVSPFWLHRMVIRFVPEMLALPEPVPLVGGVTLRISMARLLFRTLVGSGVPGPRVPKRAPGSIWPGCHAPAATEAWKAQALPHPTSGWKNIEGMSAEMGSAPPGVSTVWARAMTAGKPMQAESMDRQMAVRGRIGRASSVFGGEGAARAAGTPYRRACWRPWRTVRSGAACGCSLGWPERQVR